MVALQKLEKGDNSATYLQNFAESYLGHLHLRHNQYAKYHDPSSRGSPDILFTRSFMGQMPKPKSEKGNNLNKYWQNFMKSLSGNLPHVPKLYA